MSKFTLSQPLLTPGTIRAFNPQPEPPREALDITLNPGTIRGFNPQPEPPRELLTAQDFHFEAPLAHDWLG
jgi:hypothetical protein